MRMDLQTALSSIADVAEAHSEPLAVDRLMSRMRRRRTARAVGTSALGVGAVGAVALTGTAIVQGWWTAPPVSSAPPSPSIGGFPAVTASEPFRCGEPVPAVQDPEGDADLHFEPLASQAPQTTEETSEWGPLEGFTVAAEGSLLFDATLVNGSTQDLSARVPVQLPVWMWVVQDGVVVGEAGQATNDIYMGDETLVVPAGGTAAQPGSAEWLGTCGPDLAPAFPSDPVGQANATPIWTPSEALPPGEYDVYLEEPLPGDFVDEPSGPNIRLVGGPYRLTIGPAGTPASALGPPRPLDQLVISAGGLGDPQVHQDILLGPAGLPDPATPSPADVIRWDPAACTAAVEPGRWIPVYPDQPDPRGQLRAPFSVHVVDGQVAQVDIRTAGPRTTGGVQVGSTLAEVRSAQPDATLRTPTGDGTAPIDEWILQHNATVIVIEVATNRDGSSYWTPDEVDRVVAIALVSGSPYNTYLSPVWGSDPCRD